MADRLITAAEQIRIAAAETLDPRTQAQRGQYFTPESAATLIAGLPSLPHHCARMSVLDPGAGTGMLTAALVERIVQERPDMCVDVTAIEVDPTLLSSLQTTARLCEKWAAERGAVVTVEAACADIITSAANSGAAFQYEGFDLVAMNPPYAKLAVGSKERRAMALLGWDCPNRYATFLSLGVEALRSGGQLVAITPRSFANGPYFGQFRKRLLDALAIDCLHTFESRSTIFEGAGVLQENIVFSGTKGGQHDRVTITVSRDHRDAASEYVVGYADLVHPDDRTSFIRITTHAGETLVADRMAALPLSLPDLGLQVSTGRVVDFRARENLRDEPAPSDSPLIYPGNLKSGFVDWPRSIRKAQAFRPLAERDRRSLMPGGCYVLVKRFSAKEERRRIVAALWDPSRNGDCDIAFENHLNVFHCAGQGLDRELGWGLCLWLNGSLVDQFFRTFSGHTQVNAADLGSLRFPDANTLRQLARESDVLPHQGKLDQMIDRLTFESALA